MQLTKNTDKMFCLIYEEYLNRKKMGYTEKSAISFEHPEALQNQFLQGFHADDIHSAVHELSRYNLVRRFVNDSFTLSTGGIVYMENRFKNGIKEVLEYISLIK